MNPLPIPHLIQTCADYYGLNRADLSKGGGRSAVAARRIIVAIAREYTVLSMQDIANQLCIDASTAVSSWQKHCAEINSDPIYQRDYEYLKEALL